MAVTQNGYPSFKHIKLPYNIFVGKNVLDKVEYLAREYSGTIVFTGRNTSKVAGSRIATLLNCDQVFVEESTMEEADKLAKEINGHQLVVAVGGGKVIDVAKIAAFKKGIDYLSIPTNCSNDGIASPIASVKGKERSSFNANPPVGVIADMDMLRESPYEFTSAGFGDAIAKFSAVKDWQLGHLVKGEYFGDYASALSLMIAKITRDSAYEISKSSDQGMSTLIEALISSGAAMGIAASSRPASGSEHKFSHALDLIAEKPAMHGHQCGVGTIIMTYLHGENWMSVKSALETAKCPTTAKELGFDADIVLEAMMRAKEIRPDRYTIIEHLRLDKQTALTALESTGVI